MKILSHLLPATFSVSVLDQDNVNARELQFIIKTSMVTSSDANTMIRSDSILIRVVLLRREIAVI